MAKLLENTYRHVNIALVNEMAQFCHELGIDLWNVIELRQVQAVRLPGLLPRARASGGHCIPIDPNYLSHRVKQQLGHPFRFVELAQEINASMPAYVARRAQDMLNDNRQADQRRVRPAARRHLQAQHRRRPRVTGPAAGQAAEGRSGPG